MRVFKWCRLHKHLNLRARQKWFSWVLVTQRLMNIHTQDSKTKFNIFINMLWVHSYYSRRGCFSTIYTQHRAVSTSKLGLSSLRPCSPFTSLQMEDTPRFKILLSIYIVWHGWHTGKVFPISQPPPSVFFFLMGLQDYALNWVRLRKKKQT